MTNYFLPIISIIIPTHNSEKFLERCLLSVQQQNPNLFELIIVDNNSDDSTLQIISRFPDLVDILISEPDKNHYDAINKGILNARGDWIYILGSDDFLIDSEVLLNACKILKSLDANIYIAYGNVNVVTDDGRFLYQSGSPWTNLSRLFRSRMSIPHQGVFHRSATFTKFGLFDTQFFLAGDYDLLLRVLRQHPPCYIHMTIAGYCFTGGSSKVMNALKVQKEYRLAQKKNSYPLTLVWIVGYVRTFLRLMIWRILSDKLAPKADDFFRVLSGKKPIWTKIYR